MPVISMISPWIHPKTGVLWFRAKVPKDLQAVAARNEVKWTLGTKDKAVAAKRWPHTRMPQRRSAPLRRACLP